MVLRCSTLSDLFFIAQNIPSPYKVKNYNIHIDRKLPTDAEINKHKDFDGLMKQYEAQTAGAGAEKPGWQKWAWLPVAACLLVGTLAWYQFGTENEKPAAQTQADSQATEIAVQPEAPQELVKPATVEKPQTPEKLTPQKKEVAPSPQQPLVPAVKETKPEPQSVAERGTSTLAAPQKASRKPFRLEVENKQDFPELAAYKDYLWEYAGEDASQDPWKNNVFGAENHWDKAEVKKKGQIFEMKLSRADGSSISFPVRMVFSGKSYDEALELYQQQQ